MRYIDDALLRRPCRVGLCIDERSYLREMRRFRITSPSAFVLPGKAATMHWLYDTMGDCGSVAVVCINPDKVKDIDGIQLACVIVHEAVHVFQNICDHWGEERPGRELEAYSIQRLSQQLLYLYSEMIDSQSKKV